MTKHVCLYHFPPSLCSQKVRLALCEKGVAYTSKLVNIGPPMENYEPWYARMNPGLVVPTLVVDNDVIINSAHIIKQIDQRFDGPDLGSNNAQVDELIALQDGLKIREIAYGTHKGLIGFLTKGSFDTRLKVLKSKLHENPDLADIYERRIKDVEAWHKVSMSEQEVAALKAKLEQALDVVEARLGDGEFLVGNHYTLADVTWTVILARAKFMGFARTWHQKRPQLLAYYERMRARPSFKTADVWENMHLSVMAPIIGRVLLNRIGLR